MYKSCYTAIREALEANPDREFTTTQMRKHLRKFAHGTVSKNLNRLYEEGFAKRSREGKTQYRYSLAKR